MAKRNWFWSGFGKRTKRKENAANRRTIKTRPLLIEPLECRQLLSVGPPAWAAQIGSVGQQTTNFENNACFDSAAAVASDNGNILVVGTTGSGQFGLVRYISDPGQTDDGSPDPNFGTGGLVTTNFAAGAARRRRRGRGLRRRHDCRGRHRRGQQWP